MKPFFQLSKVLLLVAISLSIEVVIHEESQANDRNYAEYIVDKFHRDGDRSLQLLRSTKHIRLTSKTSRKIYFTLKEHRFIIYK